MRRKIAIFTSNTINTLKYHRTQLFINIAIKYYWIANRMKKSSKFSK